MEENEYCPRHGNPENPWARCPTTEQGGTETCGWLVQEMDRRIKEVTDYGNYFALLPREHPGEPRMMQEYRDHEPYGEPRILGRQR